MKNRCILSIFAVNRIGILAAVSKAMSDLGADLQEIHQAVLSGYYQLVTIADFPEHLEQELIRAHLTDVVRPFCGEVSLRSADLATPSPSISSDSDRYVLVLTGEDQPGMIRHLSSRMAMEDIDIADLYASKEPRTQCFVISMELSIPSHVDVELLNLELESWATSIQCELCLQQQNLLSCREVHGIEESRLQPGTAFVATQKLH